MKNARILVVDDETAIREGMRRILEKREFRVDLAANGHAALEKLQEDDFDLVITDLKMPGMNGLEVLKTIKILQPDVPVMIITGYATVETAVEAMKTGAFEYLSKPFTPEQVLQKACKALESRPPMPSREPIGRSIRDTAGLDFFIGESSQMQKVYRRILQVAPTDSTVLISGESGTGKELVARAIHQNSPRRNRPFVAVDCTSLAESLLESELFGHEKGSFTGATHARSGFFKVADGGTLFLDEISNIGLSTQAKLLRTLQQREVTPIGATSPVPIDIRLVAASNRNLKEMMTAKTFREDLYFRLNTIPINLPPLRERRGDLHLLLNHFLNKFTLALGKKLAGWHPEALELLRRHPFPGNVREIENIVERAVVLAEGEMIHVEDLELLPTTLDESMEETAQVPRNTEELKEEKKRLREQAVLPVERAFILNALRNNGWNISRAAEEVGMLRPNFQALLKKQNISARERPEF